jgi:hypothetical protein
MQNRSQVRRTGPAPGYLFSDNSEKHGRGGSWSTKTAFVTPGSLDRAAPEPPGSLGQDKSKKCRDASQLPAWRARTLAATAATSTGTVVSTVTSAPMPTGRSYLAMADTGRVLITCTGCLARAL